MNDKSQLKEGYALIELDCSGFYKPRANPKMSLLKAAAIFNELGGSVIVEIGSGIQGEMSGNSVLVWARKTSANKIVAIDLDEKQIQSVRQCTINYKNVETYVCDGAEYLNNFNGYIDLLYLDYWVEDLPGDVPGSGRARSYFDLYNIVKTKMRDNSLILVDDTDHIHPWKHTYLIPEARRDGYEVLYTGRQTLLRRTGAS